MRWRSASVRWVGQRTGGLPGLHRDPFDRMLVLQVQLEGLTLVSNEPRDPQAYSSSRGRSWIPSCRILAHNDSRERPRLRAVAVLRYPC